MKMQMVKMLPVAGLLLVVGSGCTSVRGVKPIQPEFGQVVSDLNPVLTWAADKDSAVSYDLEIKEINKDGIAVKVVYSKEGINGTSHKIEGDALKPGMCYSWALRTRKGETLSAWNRQSKYIELIVYASRTNRPFEFITPDAP
ncbi:MAG TPA: hypothetical protein DCS43_14925 [Verrucomicrobia bacterium]|nr:hypothetical protein [Verrucomicrobiota bacterium]